MPVAAADELAVAAEVADELAVAAEVADELVDGADSVVLAVACVCTSFAVDEPLDPPHPAASPPTRTTSPASKTFRMGD